MSDRPEIGTRFTAKAVKLGRAGKFGTTLNFRLSKPFRGKTKLSIRAATPQEAMVKSNEFFRTHPELRPKRKSKTPQKQELTVRGFPGGPTTSPLTDFLKSGLRDKQAIEILDCMSEIAAGIVAGVSAVKFADFTLVPFVLANAEAAIQKCRRALGR